MKKLKGLCNRELLSPTENTASAMPETPGLEWNLCICKLCVSLYNRCYINIDFYICTV